MLPRMLQRQPASGLGSTCSMLFEARQAQQCTLPGFEQPRGPEALQVAGCALNICGASGAVPAAGRRKAACIGW